tara:strand:- start:8778 stop:10235 length:1458 start_codon:yes stop_codon:yes gene_type:complete
MNKSKTLSILLLEGFISVSMQVLIARQLVPFIGSSVVTMSLVVGVFLAALSLGYYKGGIFKPSSVFIFGKNKKDKDKKIKEDLEQKEYLKKLSSNWYISGIFITVFFSYPFMDTFFSLVNYFINNILITSGIYLLLFLFPPVYLLGQTIPILTNFFKKSNVSEITGVSLAINTVGSVLGSLVTTLILMYYFGMAYTLFIEAILITVLILMIVGFKNMVTNFGLLILLMASYSLNVFYEKENFVATNAYGNYEVVEDNKIMSSSKYLKINTSYSSGIINGLYGFTYIQLINEYLFSNFDIKPLNNVLVMGAAGFTASEYLRKTPVKFDYVDIDSQQKEIAEKYFLEKEINGTFIPKDARNYLKGSDKKYDVVIMDLFNGKGMIPWHVTTIEFMNELKKDIREDGWVAFNIISNNNFKTAYAKKMYNTIVKTFNYCYTIPLINVSDKRHYGNVLYLCNNDSTDYSVYRDNKTDINYDVINDQLEKTK